MVESEAACSVISRSVAEPLAGTAPVAIAWLAIEQPGPFGRDALTKSHFPADLGAELDRRCKPLSIRPELIRRPGAHADTGRHSADRTVLLARATPGDVRFASMTITDPSQLLEIDLVALARGDFDSAHPDQEAAEQGALLICTHGKRDVCCALRGRPVAIELAATFGGQLDVWECSHLGGHRFAATAVALPTGWVLGRMDETAPRAGEMLVDNLVPLHVARGRSSLSPQAQYADLMYRKAFTVEQVDATSVQSVTDGIFVVDSDQAGPHRLHVRTQQSSVERPESCGGDVTPLTRFTHEWL